MTNPAMMTKEKAIRRVAAGLSALLMIWTITPTFSGVLSVGMILCVPLAAIFLLAAFPTLYRRFRRHRNLFRLSAAALSAGALLFLLACSLMIYGAARKSNFTPHTVIILGSRVYGDQPGRSLTNRLDAALPVLDTYPNCAVIATGGQAAGEDISNAEAMRRFLVSRGISDSRILTEPEARNTSENLKFARDLLNEHHLGADAVIVTDGYHQFRAYLFARQFDIAATPVSCRTHWTEIPSCLMRETLAIYRLLLLGY